MKFILMAGIPGSGKSTYIKTHFPTANVICPDAIREEFYGKGYTPSPDRERRVWDTAWNRVRDALNAKSADIVFDATSVSKRSRKEALSHIPAGVRKVCIVMKTPTLVAISRNAGRDRYVPESVIYRMAGNFTYPTPDEGFDEIVAVGD